MIDTPCILHEGRKDKDGYGSRYYPPTGKNERAHRIAYAEHHGLSMADIAGVLIRHKCDVRACINGEHLEPGTQADNVKDRVQRGRSRGPRGELSGSAVLTADKVRVIKKRLANGQHPNILASEFKVSPTAIWHIKLGTTWAHL